MQFGPDDWRRVLDFEALAECGMGDARDLSLSRLVEEPEGAREWLAAHGLLTHAPEAGAVTR